MDIKLASSYVPGSLQVKKNGVAVDPGDIVAEAPNEGEFTLDGTGGGDAIVVCYTPQTGLPKPLAQDGAGTQGTGSTSARWDHQHEHGDLSASVGQHHNAAEVTYDNGASGLTADAVQEAIDEIAAATAEITTIPTSETNTALRLAPDGTGGVEWSAGGSGGLTHPQVLARSLGA